MWPYRSRTPYAAAPSPTSEVRRGAPGRRFHSAAPAPLAPRSQLSLLRATFGVHIPRFGDMPRQWNAQFRPAAAASCAHHATTSAGLRASAPPLYRRCGCGARSAPHRRQSNAPFFRYIASEGRPDTTPVPLRPTSAGGALAVLLTEPLQVGAPAGRDEAAVLRLPRPWHRNAGPRGGGETSGATAPRTPPAVAENPRRHAAAATTSASPRSALPKPRRRGRLDHADVGHLATLSRRVGHGPALTSRHLHRGAPRGFGRIFWSWSLNTVLGGVRLRTAGRA